MAQPIRTILDVGRRNHDGASGYGVVAEGRIAAGHRRFAVSIGLDSYWAMRAWVAGMAMLVTTVLAGCGSDPAGPAFEVRIEDGSAQPVSPFFAWWGSGTGKVRQRICPEDAPTDDWSCSASGLAIRGDIADAELTIKAPGARFETVRLDALDDGSVVLGDLPALESTVTHATGAPREDQQVLSSLAATYTTALGATSLLKFYVADLDTDPKLYLQNTRLFPTHFEFAQKVLGVASTAGAFAAQTYQGEDRKAMAGTISYLPDLAVVPQGTETPITQPLMLEFFPSDDLSPSLVLRAHRLIEERFGAVALVGASRRLIYVPAGNRQETAASAAAQTLARRGVLWATAAELYAGVNEQILNPGLAYGTLRRLTPSELTQTVVSFRDILLLTRLPNDLPVVGGTITEELQTPLAHVNLLAKARQTPNIALRTATQDARIQPLLGQLVRFEVTDSGFTLAAATSADADAFYASVRHERFTPARDLDYAGLPGFDAIGFGDFVRVGSKAANLAELRHILPDTTPDGFAIPFSAYVQHLSQSLIDAQTCDGARASCQSSGRTGDPCDQADASCRASSLAGRSLAEHIELLLADAAFSSDTLLRDAQLACVRYLIANSPVDSTFASALDRRVAEVFGAAQVRLRSSTNVEDLADFNGAGLYESYSAHATGNERASSVVRRIWASVFGFSAFEERAYWNVDQGLVAMGVAVNPAFDGERANGVIITGGVAPCGQAEIYVNVQKGEESVTNPTNGATPEAFCIVPGPGATVQARILAYSSFSPKSSLLISAEVAAIERAARTATAHFAPLYGKSPNEFSLDLEFKIMGDQRSLVLKQARPFAGR